MATGLSTASSSLVEHSVDGMPCVRWVHWDIYKAEVNLNDGRFFCLDEHYRIVYRHPGKDRANVLDLAPDIAEHRLQLLVPDTKCPMIKATPLFRTDMDLSVRVVANFYERMLEAHSLDAQCPVCRSPYGRGFDISVVGEFCAARLDGLRGGLSMDDISGAMREAAACAKERSLALCELCELYVDTH